MNDESSAFGMNPEQIDKLLAWPLDTEAQGNPTASLAPFTETTGGRIGRYKLIRILGEGGMGIVYLAEQEEPVRRQVALKVIKPGMDSKRVIARFEAEQQALALMEHTHIARVYDAGLAPSGRPYFVMEHVKGIPITEHCDKSRLTIEQRLRLFLHVCQAVQHAHQKGIIHRDLKPSNILVVVQDQETVPKVIDFGIARAMSQPLTERTLYTEHGQMVGTPEYVSPEQADPSNQDIDTRTDIYSLGVVLYELLTGVLPFDPKTLREGGIDHIRKVICQTDPKTPSTRISTVSAEESTELAQRRGTDVRTLGKRLRGDLDWITLRAVEKDRTRRYATVDALATDIRNFLAHQPVNAAPPGFMYRARKFARRHRQALAVAAMIALIIAGGSWVAFMSVRAAREHSYVESLEHQRLLDNVHMLTGSKKYRQALGEIEPLLDSPHVGRQARLARARVRLEQKNFNEALPELEALADGARQDEIAGQAHALLSNVYYEGDPCAPGQASNYHQFCEDHREQAERLIGGSATYYFLQARATLDVQESLVLLARALQLDRQHYDSLRERAHIYQAQKDYQEMAVDAACMITVQPNNPQGFNLLAIAHREMGQLDKALPNHDEAIRLSPEDPDLYDARRDTLMRKGQYDLALKDALKCAELRPWEPSYLFKPLAVYTAMGRYDLAEEHFAKFAASPVASRPYDCYNLANNPGIFFHLFLCRHIFESLGAGRPWHPSKSPPHTAPYALAHEADTSFRRWSSQARRIITTGFDPSWSPDGMQLVYSQGLHTGSVVASFDLKTGRTKLLASPGRDPQWSPDGRYIAFVKDRWVLPPNTMGHLNCLAWIMDGERPRHVEEIWIMDLKTRRTRRIAAGAGPHWAGRSDHLYYYAGADRTLYRICAGAPNSPPVAIMTDCKSSRPRVSPDERYVADCQQRELQIIDLATQEVVTKWLVPPVLRDTLLVRWSPQGNELSIGSFLGSEMGLWIYTLETGAASKLLPASVATAAWSPDGKRLAICIGPPFVEIWLADLTPGRPTMESFDSAENLERHTNWLLDKLTREIKADPGLIYAYDQRADCALWTGHERAAEYLREYEQVLTSYHASACARRAKSILNWPAEQRDRLLSMARLLARKAVEEQPQNQEYREILHRATRAGAK